MSITSLNAYRTANTSVCCQQVSGALCFRLMFPLQGHSKPRNSWTNLWLKEKKNKNRGLSICRLLWILHETNLKPGQNVIAGLHERMFAKTQVERSTLDEKEATIAFLHTRALPEALSNEVNINVFAFPVLISLNNLSDCVVGKIPKHRLMTALLRISCRGSVKNVENVHLKLYEGKCKSRWNGAALMPQ